MVLYRCAQCGSLRILAQQPNACGNVSLEAITKKPRACRGEMQACTAEPVGAGGEMPFPGVVQ